MALFWITDRIIKQPFVGTFQISVHLKAIWGLEYLCELLQPQLHPLQDGIDVTDGDLWVLPLGFESAANNATCMTTETEGSEGLRYFLSHF